MENFSMAYLKKINYELCYSYNIGIVIEIGVFLKEFAVTFLYFYDFLFFGNVIKPVIVYFLRSFLLRAS